MRLLPRQKIWLVLVVSVNAALWLISSNVVELVARDEQTLLGRYSRTHFAWNIAVLLVSAVGCYIDWSRGERYKRRWFQVVAVVIFLLPSLALADRLLRTPQAEHYVRETPAYRRPSNAMFNRSFVDRPNAYRTYPNAKPGFGTVDCRLQTDARGYRNQTALETYDIVALGDSFTEGSNVSDEHPWPVRLAGLTGRSVYNLGISGYDPFHYRESLREVGLSLRPRVVICMIYEGNDFRSTKSDEKRRDPGVAKRFQDYVARSPLISRADQLLVDFFGPIGSHAPLANSLPIDWLPVGTMHDGDTRYYAFEPKQLRDLYQSADGFAADKHWISPREQLAEIHDLCRQGGAELVVAFAPTKAHVVLPLAAAGLDPRAVREFAAIGLGNALPDGGEFLQLLMSRLDARETVVGEWCKANGARFVGLTQALRQKAAEGSQVYYTYDQHWTPPGHEAVAAAMASLLQAASTVAGN